MQAIDKKTGVLMEVWPSSRKDDKDKQVFVSKQGFRYDADELTFPEKAVAPKRIYAVLYNDHEFDDLDYGDTSPVFLSMNKERARAFYDRLVEMKKKEGRRSEEEHYRYYKDDGEPFYEEDSDNTDTQFCYYLGKWCYTYRFEEYLMDSETVKPEE